ncbi:hypothetical protein [Salinimicrobium sp. GXAS 041]|uniref:hypothetical protein n=1 Tax=Salinimicrobium sp. GXAS 041 TaxID=3400806 RepID=UPI003C73FCAC
MHYNRFKPHPKNPEILVGKTYKIPNYKKPYWVELQEREKAKEEFDAIEFDDQ